jgi:hypothetical protein
MRLELNRCWSREAERRNNDFGILREMGCLEDHWAPGPVQVLA